MDGKPVFLNELFSVFVPSVDEMLLRLVLVAFYLDDDVVELPDVILKGRFRDIGHLLHL